jgi:hypothetical protein
MPLYINISNPAPKDVVPFFGRKGKGSSPQLGKIDDLEKLWLNKYDGTITEDYYKPYPRNTMAEFVTNNPSNIKSAIGNNGMFDMTNPNIYKGLIPAGIATGLSLEKKKQGGVIKDNRGQWDHPGEITEINSNYITMGPDPETGKPIRNKVLGVSNTGDTKLMEPGKDYKFKGKKVTEYPLMQKGGRVGINDLDAQPKKKLNQLLNFTNNPDKNWLDNL